MNDWSLYGVWQGRCQRDKRPAVFLHVMLHAAPFVHACAAVTPMQSDPVKRDAMCVCKLESDNDCSAWTSFCPSLKKDSSQVEVD